MIEIRLNGERLDLPDGFSIEIEDVSPVFSDRGSQSVVGKVPGTGRNRRALGWADRVDGGDDPNNPGRVVDLASGSYLRRGILNVTEAGGSDGIGFNIGFDNSTAYASWRERRLRDIRVPAPFRPSGRDGVDGVLDYLYGVYLDCDPQECEFGIFPVAVGRTDRDSGDVKATYWEFLNVTDGDGFRQDGSVRRVIDSEVTDVAVPAGYGVSPFLRAWRVVELVFEDLGLSTDGNPLRDDRELSRVVVLNNSADTVCVGEIRYEDLLPDCSVEEFMNSLWVRFGLVYDVDFDGGRVRLRLLRDILRGEICGDDLSLFASERERIIYNGAQYVRLSAGTGLEGASPASERFEDFARGLDTGSVSQGVNVAGWHLSGSGGDVEWDHDLWNGYDPGDEYDPDDPWEDDRDNYEDPDEDRDDEREHRVPVEPRESATRGVTTVLPDGHGVLAREVMTGMWYRLDRINGNPCESSTGFFNWDPAPEGMDALDLVSVDECVPIVRIGHTGTMETFSGYVPAYLAGSRHYHSYVVGSDGGEDASETPLAFMLALTTENGTVGRLSPENESGLPMTLKDGSQPSLTLYFQFRDGLFARFWRDYDRILRHGNRVVEVGARFPRSGVRGILDPLIIRRFGNVRCMVESGRYSLPSGRETEVDLKLRTIQTQGNYNIEDEQGVPAVSVAMFRLVWRIIRETYGESLDSTVARVEAVDNFIQESGYEPRVTPSGYYCVAAVGAQLRELTREGATWRTDSTLPVPREPNRTILRTYRARLHYDIHEVFYPGSTDDSAEVREVCEDVIGTGWADVAYSVTLQAKKVVSNGVL